MGAIDLYAAVAGGSDFEELLPFTQLATAANVACRVVTLPKLIQLKRSAGRAKDLEAVAELEALLEERNKLN